MSPTSSFSSLMIDSTRKLPEDEALRALTRPDPREHMDDPRVILLATPPPPSRSPLGCDAGRVLLVEDDTSSRETLARLLNRRHYSVVAVATSAEARAAAASSAFDVLLSDIGLADGDGCDLMTSLHALHGLSGIAITGYGRGDDVARGRRAGFLFLLIKPVTIQSLEQALATVTRNSRPADSA